MVETFDAWVRELGPLGYLALALAALIEYLVPPFPGDTVVLLGGAYAVRSDRSLLLVLLAVSVASALGMSANYAVGRLLHDRIAHYPEGHTLYGVRFQRIRELQDRMRRHGPWLLVANRFLPSFRSVLFIAAGASRMPLRSVLGWGMVSAVSWNGLLLVVGSVVGSNADRLERLVRDYQRGALAVLGLVLLGFAAHFLWKRRKARGAA